MVPRVSCKSIRFCTQSPRTHIRKPDLCTYPQERAELAEAEAKELRQSVEVSDAIRRGLEEKVAQLEKEASASNTKMGTLSQMVEELRSTISNLKKELSMYKLQSGKLISQLEQQCDR